MKYLNALMIMIVLLVGCKPVTEGTIIEKSHEPVKTGEELRTFVIEQNGITRDVQRTVIIHEPERFNLVVMNENGRHTISVPRQVWAVLDSGDYVKVNRPRDINTPEKWLVLDSDELVPVLGRIDGLGKDSVMVQ